MKPLEAAPGVLLTPGRVKFTDTASGWVARIGGPHPKYELKRDFLDRIDGTRRQVKGEPLYSAQWLLRGNGLYEFCNHRRGSRGFFVVTGTLRRRVALVDKAEAFRRAGATLPA